MAKGTVNKVIILGRLGQDPEVRSTASGTQIVNLNVATNEIGKADDQGQRQELTEWHRITIFGRMGENAAQYLRKGSMVYIEGRLQTRKWQDQNGQDRYSTDIIANEMQFIGGKPDNQGSQHGGYQQQGTAQATGTMAAQQQHASYSQQQAPRQQQGGFQQPTGQPAPRPGGFDDFEDSIPF